MFRQLSAVCRVSQQVFSRSVRSFSSKVDLPKTSSVHISNLPGETTDEDLRYLFAGYGPVTDIRIKNTYAFVEFGRVEDALYAIKELNCTELQGEIVYMALAHPRPPVNINWDEYLKDFKQYSPEELLVASKFYWNQDPSDYIQACEKSYLAAVYCIKMLALEQGILLSSHEQVGEFCDFLFLNKTFLDIDSRHTSSTMVNGFTCAEALHRFRYETFLDRATIKKYMNNVKLMVNVSQKIDRAAIKTTLDGSTFLKKCVKTNKEIPLGEDHPSKTGTDDRGVPDNDGIICNELDPTLTIAHA
ncbi:hypothetical protein ACQ4LE_003824 [Meloidogyne hapla]